MKSSEMNRPAREHGRAHCCTRAVRAFASRRGFGRAHGSGVVSRPLRSRESQGSRRSVTSLVPGAGQGRFRTAPAALLSGCLRAFGSRTHDSNLNNVFFSVRDRRPTRRRAQRPRLARRSVPSGSAAIRAASPQPTRGWIATLGAARRRQHRSSSLCSCRVRRTPRRRVPDSPLDVRVGRCKPDRAITNPSNFVSPTAGRHAEAWQRQGRRPELRPCERDFLIVADGGRDDEGQAADARSRSV